MLAAIFSALHLLALAIGLPSVFLRGRALRGRLDESGLRRLFLADTFWGVAAGLWIVTGLVRAFAGLGKDSQFYLSSPLFLVKMGLLIAVLLLEIWPMVTFIRWRIARCLSRNGRLLSGSVPAV
jgi:putative membrane protein